MINGAAGGLSVFNFRISRSALAPGSLYETGR